VSPLCLSSMSIVLRSASFGLACLLTLQGVDAQDMPRLYGLQRPVLAAERLQFAKNTKLIARLEQGITAKNASIARLIGEVLSLKESLKNDGSYFPAEDFDPPLSPPAAATDSTIELQRQRIEVLTIELQNRIEIEKRLKKRRGELHEAIRRMRKNGGRRN